MASDGRRLVFGRINRRHYRETLQTRPFAEDMAVLAESHRTEHHQKASKNTPARTWQAADMNITADGNFLTGILGFSEKHQQVDFNGSSWSWLKGETHDSDAAGEAMLAPFAIDLREHNRWIAFVVTPRIQPPSFAAGFQRVLNQAASELNLIPTSWEVDLVTSKRRIHEWLTQNPRVYLMRRTIKFTNPGLDLDSDRQQMRALLARRKTEDFAAYPGKTLDVESDAFEEKLDGIETGDVDVIVKARGSHDASSTQFNTHNNVDHTTVSDFGSDLVEGMETVLSALREYVANREGDHGPEPLDGQ